MLLNLCIIRRKRADNTPGRIWPSRLADHPQLDQQGNELIDKLIERYEWRACVIFTGIQRHVGTVDIVAASVFRLDWPSGSLAITR
jgi:hypothetical protein